MGMRNALIMIGRARCKISATGQLTLVITEFTYTASDGSGIIGTPRDLGVDEEIKARMTP